MKRREGIKKRRNKEERKKVGLNLIKLGINRLIIGGDGSLTGAQLLFDNWGERKKKE